MSVPKKTVIEVHDATHKSVTRRAKQLNMPTKRFASMLLDFAVKKEKAGELEVVQEVKENV